MDRESGRGGIVYIYVWGGRSECLLHVFFSCSVLQFLRQSLSYCLNCSSLLVHWPLRPRIFESLVLCIEIIRAPCQTWHFLWVLLSELGSLCLHDKGFPVMISPVRISPVYLLTACLFIQKSATTMGVDSPDETRIYLSRKGRGRRTTVPPGKGPGAQLCLFILCENTHPGSSPEERAD